MTKTMDSTPDLPQPFGYKTNWWAVQSNDIHAVAEAIGLSNARPCNWASGIPASYNHWIFVSPPIDEWILVAGTKLPPKGNNVASECLSSLLNLSKQFNDVQLFATHRVVGYQVWARAIGGELFRGFAFLGESGEILWNIGNDTTETDLDLDFPSADDLESDPEILDEFDWPDEEHVMLIAKEWSISPLELDIRQSTGVGLIGSDAKLVSNSV